MRATKTALRDAYKTVGGLSERIKRETDVNSETLLFESENNITYRLTLVRDGGRSKVAHEVAYEISNAQGTEETIASIGKLAVVKKQVKKSLLLRIRPNKLDWLNDGTCLAYRREFVEPENKAELEEEVHAYMLVVNYCS
ncbi:hypothetical protein COV18_02560 [Candidatus Woesearchaeota archaeon CG10_big_fil_rev_8_21_14_0_10_37_12]|nr:MAG: hypothetical protein COV18_02560 [Candidatus Woesearchaeota archaeon CG10_big_fil_rev_8_21_14_0_10_37_12]